MTSYGRITARIDKKLTSKERLEVRRILQWIACSKSPLRKQELLQALQIKPGDRAIVPERKLLRDVFQLCGPIIETRGEHVVFVHFTVKE